MLTRTLGDGGVNELGIRIREHGGGRRLLGTYLAPPWPMSIGAHAAVVMQLLHAPSATGDLPARAAAAVSEDAPMLDVWMLPHAHCDVGWLMSVDGYFNPRHYDGTENVDSVSNILSSVTHALDADTSLRFIWSETKWIQMWWPAQTPVVQAAFKRIIARGQFEFVGAVSQPSAAA